MYTIIRKIHLYIALFLFLLTLMYFISGYVMIHEPWFGRPKAKVTQEIKILPRPLPLNEPAISEYLQSEINLPGKSIPVRKQDNGTLVFEYWRPGEAYEVILTPNDPEITIKRHQWGWQEITIGFHRMHGYNGGILYIIWAFLLDIVSLAMIVFGITGIILWFKLTKNRFLGWILLSVTYIYSIATILYLMYAP